MWQIPRCNCVDHFRQKSISRFGTDGGRESSIHIHQAVLRDDFKGNLMAASSKPTAVHFALAFSVMTTIVLGLVCYMTASENQKLKVAAETARTTAASADQRDRQSQDDITLLKKKLGYVDFDQIGAEADNTPNTVVGSLNRDLALYGKEQVQPNAASPTVAATLQSLRSALNAALQNVQERQTQLVAVQAELAQEIASHKNRVKELADSQAGSEDQLKSLVATRTEQLAQKDAETAKWRDEFRREQREKESLRDELDQVRKSKDSEIHDLENIVAFLRQKLNELEDLSFDKADGAIVRVDNTTRSVWINLGSDDGIRPQVTFAVYTRSHEGFGRGNADIKAKIEVTKVRGPHLSEARILKDDISRPIQADDPIYSPVWTKNAKEYFSFVGIVDMDGDGKSDRELLHNTLENANSGIELEIDDLGNRVPEGAGLSVKSKFLVIGKIEDPADFPGTDEAKQEQVRKILDEYAVLTKEALRKGIKVITFNDFLNYMGYEQQHRLYNTSANQKFNLKSGARSASTNEELGSSRISTGQTSKRFQPVDKSKLQPQQP
ncbi:hypothetical protein SH661x_004076 [Planctomicrobium sp. SH661]|uniref:hypothetical protein n=1 Tax=Planctomicrobium sp. SH661 TaxID=3448124 RepID=UPI003F5BD5D0